MREQRMQSLEPRSRAANWEEQSRFGAIGAALRSTVRRVAQPITSRQERHDVVVRRAIMDAALLANLEALSSAGVDASDVEVLDTEIGAMLFHAADEVMTPFVRAHRVWEADETAFMRATIRPGQAVLDCGANVGWHSVLAAGLVGPQGTVVSVEPEPRNLGLLRANLWRHAPANALVVPTAAGEERGLIELRVDEGNRGDHQTHRIGTPGEGRAAMIVGVVPLDELFEDASFDFVKVDAQGVDHEVLAGLGRTLRRSPDPTVMVEFWLTGMEQRGVSPTAVLNGYRGSGFKIGLLGVGGEVRAVGDEQILDAAEDGGTRVVNLVLERA